MLAYVPHDHVARLHLAWQDNFDCEQAARATLLTVHPTACRFIKVDEYSKTNIDNIYAVGDITDRMALTPVALMEGGAVANTLFNNNPTKPDHMFVPTAVFSQPHIGTCGYPEDKAVEKFGDVDVFTSGFTPMRIGFAGGLTRGYYKIIVDKNSDRVVGMHMIGPDSGEIMQVSRFAVQLSAVRCCYHCLPMDWTRIAARMTCTQLPLGWTMLIYMQCFSLYMWLQIERTHMLSFSLSHSCSQRSNC